MPMKSGDMWQSQQVPAAVETLQRAMAAIQSQQPDQAVRLAKDVLNKNPSHPNALQPLERAYRSLRDPAIETQLAIALRKAGRTHEALKRLARASKKVPPFPAAIHE